MFSNQRSAFKTQNLALNIQNSDGAPGWTRTGTRQLLRLPPLPLGYEGNGFVVLSFKLSDPQAFDTQHSKLTTQNSKLPWYPWQDSNLHRTVFETAASAVGLQGHCWNGSLDSNQDSNIQSVTAYR